MTEPAWSHVDYAPGTDSFWDVLNGSGVDWGALDGPSGARLYVTWDEQPSGRMVVAGVCLRGSSARPVTAESLRSIPIGRLEAAPNEVAASSARRGLAKAPRLHRPDGRNVDGFYKSVATHYRWHAALSRRPAAAMAEAAGVPVATVHRWIREARLRGFLPAGRQGSVG